MGLRWLGYPIPNLATFPEKYHAKMHSMTEDKWLSKPKQQARTLNEEIAYQQRKARERHQKAVRARINSSLTPFQQHKESVPSVPSQRSKRCLKAHAEQAAPP